MESLKDKHKPLDHDLLEEQQKQHQIIPPHNPEEDEEENEHKVRTSHNKVANYVWLA